MVTPRAGGGGIKNDVKGFFETNPKMDFSKSTCNRNTIDPYFLGDERIPNVISYKRRSDTPYNIQRSFHGELEFFVLRHF
jgi:hypothetical protein